MNRKKHEDMQINRRAERKKAKKLGKTRARGSQRVIGENENKVTERELKGGFMERREEEKARKGMVKKEM